MPTWHWRPSFLLDFELCYFCVSELSRHDSESVLRPYSFWEHPVPSQNWAVARGTVLAFGLHPLGQGTFPAGTMPLKLLAFSPHPFGDWTAPVETVLVGPVLASVQILFRTRLSLPELVLALSPTPFGPRVLLLKLCCLGIFICALEKNLEEMGSQTSKCFQDTPSFWDIGQFCVSSLLFFLMCLSNEKDQLNPKEHQWPLWGTSDCSKLIPLRID